MKAAYIDTPGSPDGIRYGDLPKPAPGNGEVLVRVGAVSVNRGTGGVGSRVVQIAKGVSARVATTVGSPDKAKLCRSWGADAVMNYKTDDVAAGVRAFTGAKGLDVWYETQREPDYFRI